MNESLQLVARRTPLTVERHDESYFLSSDHISYEFAIFDARASSSEQFVIGCTRYYDDEIYLVPTHIPAILCEATRSYDAADAFLTIARDWNKDWSDSYTLWYHYLRLCGGERWRVRCTQLTASRVCAALCERGGVECLRESSAVWCAGRSMHFFAGRRPSGDAVRMLVLALKDPLAQNTVHESAWPASRKY